jgi:hypothetical protein
MRKTISMAVAVFAVMVSSGVALAQSMPAHAATKNVAVYDKTFDGEIVAVDVRDNTFTVRKTVNDKVEEMEFHVDLGSKIMIDGKRTLIGELERGEPVTVTYETVNGMHKAKEIKRHKA